MKKITILALILVTSFGAFAQDAKFQAMFIYNFTRTLQWPTENQKGNFVIGVLGDSDLYKELEAFTKGKKVKGVQQIIVKKVELDQINNCHIIVVTSGKKGMTPEVVKSIKNKNTLVISEGAGMTEKGAGIAFAKDESGIVKYQFNEENIQKQGISVSTSFREVGEKR